MKKSFPLILAFAVLFLFFIQTAGTLVESIYILDLMNTSLDEKALGVLFFFAPLLLLPFCRKFSRRLAWVAFALLLVSRGILPYIKTAPQVSAAGLGILAAVSLIFLLLKAKPRGQADAPTGLWGSAAFALTLALQRVVPGT